MARRLEELRGSGPFPAVNKDGSVDLGPDGSPTSRAFPHPDDPLRHAEVKAVNDLLQARGRGAPGGLSEFLVDNTFVFDRLGPRPAPCCANCAGLMYDVSSGSGRFTGFPPVEEGFRPR